MSQLSRRSLLSRAAILPALALPALAASTVVAASAPALAGSNITASVPSPVAPNRPSKMERLWAEAKAAKREHDVNQKLCEKLAKILETRMPDPDPSIVFGNPENDADGLEYWVPDREPFYFKHYIFSGWLEGKLEAANEPTLAKVIRRTKGKNGSKRATLESRAADDEPFPVTQEQLALRERLARRLELSRQYERKMKRTKREIGLTAAEKKRDNACDRQVYFQNKILAMPATTRADFAVKIAVYKHYDRDIGAEEIVRDVERLVKLPRDFAKAWGFDPNAAATVPTA